MKKEVIIGLMWLFLCFSQHATAQDTTKTKRYTEAETDEPEETENEPTVKPKKKIAHRFGMSLEVGPYNSFILAGGSLNEAVLGWRAGSFLYVPLVGKLYLQPGIFYSVGGGATSESNISTSFGTPVAGGSNNPTYTYNTNRSELRVNSLEIPVNFGFRFGRPRYMQTTFMGIGGYVGYNLMGRYSYVSNQESGSHDLGIGTSTSDDIKPIDYGLGFNSSMEWRHMGLVIRATVQYGLANLNPDTKGTTLNKFGYGFQVGYVVGKRDRRKAKPTKDDTYMERRMRP